MNNKTLKSLKDRPKEERKAIAKKGGIASVKAKKEKAKIKELVNDLLYSDNLTKEEIEELAKVKGIDKKEVTTATYLVYSLFNKAKKGDIRAFDKLLELVGEDSKSEQFNKNLAIKEREIAIREKELELKERSLDIKQDIGDIASKVVIVELGNNKANIQQELANRGLENASTIIVNDLDK